MLFVDAAIAHPDSFSAGVDTDLRTSVPKTGFEEDLIYNPFFANARVYISTPGNGREGFTFRPKPGKFFSKRTGRVEHKSGDHLPADIDDLVSGDAGEGRRVMMSWTRLLTRSLQYHLRIHGPVALGVAAAYLLVFVRMAIPPIRATVMSFE